MNLITHNLRVLIEHSRLSQRDFAKKFGVGRPYLESLLRTKGEKGRGRLRVEFTNGLCNYFGITSEQLVKQKLTPDDLQVNGSVKSLSEVQLEEAHKRIALLENTVKDKDRIIELLSKK